MANIRAALYCRVSTTDQNSALQIRELTEYVQRRGWELVDTYQDTISGAKASRPGLERLMQAARFAQVRCRTCLQARPLGQEPRLD
jgi:DNA invertase Pin-like site-specific DNA recombinase